MNTNIPNTRMIMIYIRISHTERGSYIHIVSTCIQTDRDLNRKRERDILILDLHLDISTALYLFNAYHPQAHKTSASPYDTSTLWRLPTS